MCIRASDRPPLCSRRWPSSKALRCLAKPSGRPLLPGHQRSRDLIFPSRRHRRLPHQALPRQSTRRQIFRMSHLQVTKTPWRTNWLPWMAHRALAIMSSQRESLSAMRSEAVCFDAMTGCSHDTISIILRREFEGKFRGSCPRSIESGFGRMQDIIQEESP